MNSLSPIKLNIENGKGNVFMTSIYNSNNINRVIHRIPIIVIFRMIPKTLIISLTVIGLIVSSTAYTTWSPCPVNIPGRSAISGSLIVQSGGTINMPQDQESQCYDYTLQQKFSGRPDVALSINEFSSPSSNELFFSVKPIVGKDNGSVTFLIRTPQKHTKWVQITFAYFIEDRTDIDSGYYLVDPGPLSGCRTGKTVDVLLPYQNRLEGKTKANVFLHGFEIASVPEKEGYSPLEVQILKFSTEYEGVKVTLSVTSATQVFSLYISYIVYVAGKDIYGEFFEQQKVEGSSLSRSFQIQGAAYLYFYGISGFIINNNPKYNYKLGSKWNNASLTCDFGQTVFQYLSVNYIVLTGNPCYYCNGYQIFFDNKCQTTCPQGYYYNGYTCLTCPYGQIWNGTQCVSTCQGGQVWNINTAKCECVNGTYWNGWSCITCPQSQVWNQQLGKCDCPYGQIWNGYNCMTCPQGQIWNQSLNKCDCPAGQSWNGYNCMTCPQGQIWSQSLNKCDCPTGQSWNGYNCIICPQGQIWNQLLNKCDCPAGQSWNGYSCATINCPQGQIWSIQTYKCQCPSGLTWNGWGCINTTCAGGKTYNYYNSQCECPAGQIWNFNHCQSNPCPPGQVYNFTTSFCACPQGTFFNGIQCIRCPAGQIWNDAWKKCDCPQGQRWNGYNCENIQCENGKVWNNSTASCECPYGLLWNGTICTNQPCSQGKIWNYQIGQCVCPQNGNWNGNQCVTCPAGKLWDEKTRLCECPSGQYWSGLVCAVCEQGKTWNPNEKKCICPAGSTWNLTKCQTDCPSGQQNINGKCFCPENSFWTGYKCVSCPGGQMWNGISCVAIQCPPGSFWDGIRCANGNKCPENHYSDGSLCVPITIRCPPGTVWKNNTCQPDNSQCQEGYYYLKENQKCVPIPSKCPPYTSWDSYNNKCVPNATGLCPSGSYFNGSTCVSVNSCPAGQVWSQDSYKCMCPDGYIWNGNSCNSCPGDRIYKDSRCQCSDGSYWNGNKCQYPNNNKCYNIKNSNWNGTHCVCLPGFSVIGFDCVCEGLDLGTHCDRCYSKPNSIYYSGICKCKDEYYEVNGQCLKRNQTPNPPTINNTCEVATYFDNQEKRCLPCSEGCLTCTTCYDCSKCRVGYQPIATTGLCRQVCGDGLRFTVQCDDGNNKDGDGCSADCRIQPGYTCFGGSPTEKDSCTSAVPAKIGIKVTGQTHLYGQILLNVQLNYLPAALLDSSFCNVANQCNKILVVELIQGFKSYTSIVAKYIPTTSFSFSIVIDFKVEPIGIFTTKIRVNPELQQYFKGIDLSTVAQVQVNPALLSQYMGATNTEADLLN